MKVAHAPVAEERAEDHERILHQRHDLLCVGALQQQLASRLERREAETVLIPLGHHLLQLRFNVLLFRRRDTDVLE